MKKVAIISLLLFISACNSPRNETPNRALYQTWIDSREENKVNSPSHIYRPESFKQFPISRFRMKYSFFDNGTCNYTWLSPIDKHEMRSCSYTYNKGSIQLFDESKQKLERLKVFTLSTNKLVIQRIR